jgi:hypothetical protein
MFTRACPWILKGLRKLSAYLYRVLFNIIHMYTYTGGRDSSVDITTGYGLDGQEIESRWRRDFSRRFRPALVPNQPPV